jgi:branched-chain amino acid transport system ATP-binding protein
VIGPNGAADDAAGGDHGHVAGQRRIRYQNEAIGSLSVEQRVGGGLVLVPEKRDLFASMTVSDNLELGAFARASWRSRHCAHAGGRLCALSRLQERRAQLAGTLSGASDRCWRWDAR